MMKTERFTKYQAALCVAALLLFALCARAGDAEKPTDAKPPADENVEDAKTPATLAELLPKGGIEKVDVDFFLVMKQLEGPGGGGEEMVMHWTIKPRDGKLVAAMRNASAEGASQTQRVVYSKAGKLESLSSRMEFGGDFDSKTEGKVEGDTLVVTSNGSRFGPDDGEDAEPKRIPLKDFAGTIDPALMPLVFAYHIRQGNLGYSFKARERTADQGAQLIRIEDVGTETVEFGGKKLQAHVLLMKIKYERGKDAPEFDIGEQQFTLHVLDTGEFMQMAMNIKDAGEFDFSMKAERISAKEGKEKLEAIDKKREQAKKEREKEGDAEEPVEPEVELEDEPGAPVEDASEDTESE